MSIFESLKTGLEQAINGEVRKIDMATSVRKHGEWVHYIAYYDEDGCPCIVSRCSECGEAYPESNFCPNCGADMRGKNNG